MSKVVCVLPTRGLVYANTVKGLFNNQFNDLIVVSGRPMPDCFNEGISKALLVDCEYIWMVEEDNELPKGILEKMLKEKKDIVTIDYNVGGGVSHIQRDEGGEIIWCGVGCTLIKRKVFETIPQPWFKVDVYQDQKTGEWHKWPDHQIPKKFGGHDVWFFTQARNYGFKINVLDGVKGLHFRAKEITKREMNQGSYTIYSL
jgi:hypothetical protein